MASPLPLPRLMSTSAVVVKQLRWPLFLLGFALAYLVAARLGIATSLPPAGIVILWPPNAIVLAALLSVKRERWWLLFLVTVATEIAADVPAYPLWAAAGHGIVNFSEAAIAAILLSKFSDDAPPLVDLRDFIRFVAIGPVLASGTAALLGAAIYKIGAADLDYLHYWRVFWLGDALGLLTVGTALLAWKRPAASSIRPSPSVAAEGAVLLLGLLAVSSWALLADAGMLRVYLIFPSSSGRPSASAFVGFDRDHRDRGDRDRFGSHRARTLRRTVPYRCRGRPAGADRCRCAVDLHARVLNRSLRMRYSRAATFDRSAPRDRSRTETILSSTCKRQSRAR